MKKLILFIILLALINSAFAQAKLIYDIKVNRVYNLDLATLIPQGYLEISAKFALPLPSSLAAVPNVSALAESYRSMYGIDSVDLINSKIIFSGRVTPPLSVWKDGVPSNGLTDANDVQNALKAVRDDFILKLSMFQLMPFDTVIGTYWNGTNCILE